MPILRLDHSVSRLRHLPLVFGNVDSFGSHFQTSRQTAAQAEGEEDFFIGPGSHTQEYATSATACQRGRRALEERTLRLKSLD